MKKRTHSRIQHRLAVLAFWLVCCFSFGISIHCSNPPAEQEKAQGAEPTSADTSGSTDTQNSTPDSSTQPDNQTDPPDNNTGTDTPQTTPDTTAPDAAQPDPSSPEPTVQDTTNPPDTVSPPDTTLPPDKVTPEPTPEVIADKPTGRIIRVGPTRKYKKPSEAARIVIDGDTVEIDKGLYKGDVAVWRKNRLTIRGVGGKAHLAANGNSAERKATWVIKGNDTVLENIEFSGAKVKDRNGAGIRQEGTNLTIRHCYFHDNENGILAGGNANSTILIEYSIFARNGYGKGYTHNMYINRIKHFILRYSYTHHTKVGHNVKSRAMRNEILYNRITDEKDGNSSYNIDIPNGGPTYIIGNIVQQSPKASNSTVISYGAEGLKNPSSAVYLVNNTIVNNRHAGNFFRVGGKPGTVKVLNNLMIGNGSFQKQSGWDVRGNIVSKTFSGFVNAGSFDYRLKSSASAKNKGVAVGKAGSYSLQPKYQYKHTANREARKISGTLDVGAFEAP